MTTMTTTKATATITKTIEKSTITTTKYNGYNRDID